MFAPIHSPILTIITNIYVLCGLLRKSAFYASLLLPRTVLEMFSEPLERNILRIRRPGPPLFNRLLFVLIIRAYFSRLFFALIIRAYYSCLLFALIIRAFRLLMLYYLLVCHHYIRRILSGTDVTTI